MNLADRKQPGLWPVSGLYACLIARGDTPVWVSPALRGLAARRQGGSQKSHLVVRVPHTLPQVLVLRRRRTDCWAHCACTGTMRRCWPGCAVRGAGSWRSPKASFTLRWFGL
jgi:hypothetical protein